MSGKKINLSHPYRIKSYKQEISNLIQKQEFSIEEFQSITDKFGKILYFLDYKSDRLDKF